MFGEAQTLSGLPVMLMVKDGTAALQGLCAIPLFGNAPVIKTSKKATNFTSNFLRTFFIV
jgi:hypothetical protein